MKTTIELTPQEVEMAVAAHVMKLTGKTPSKYEAIVKTVRHSDFMDRDSWTTAEFQGYKVELD